MKYSDLELAFQFAEEQARAIKTLYASGCIPAPNFKSARDTLIANLKPILCGAVPYTANEATKTVMREDMPHCISAFRIIAVQSVAYDQLIANMPPPQEIKALIEGITLATLQQAEDDRHASTCSHLPDLTAQGTEL